MNKKIIIFLSLICAIIFGMFIYFSCYYKCESSVKKYLISNNNVKVNKTDNGYFFDGEGSDSAIIFYPGAKVEYTSYAPLMSKIASSGVDTFLIDMPLNFAFFHSNAADDIIKNYDYKHYYMSGHSLGGVVAANYANKNTNKIEGIILLASYSPNKINNNLKVLSIYGDKDGVLNINAYNKSKKNYNDSFDEYVILGANHSGFGNYGNQKHDNKSSISKEEQQNITKDKIINFILK